MFAAEYGGSAIPTDLMNLPELHLADWRCTKQLRNRLNKPNPQLRERDSMGRDLASMCGARLARTQQFAAPSERVSVMRSGGLDDPSCFDDPSCCFMRARGYQIFRWLVSVPGRFEARHGIDHSKRAEIDALVRARRPHSKPATSY
jgi:hypothetical protein